MKTIGGRQFWGDVYYFQGYRIQQNIVTRHYRLLNPDDIRLAFGKYETCIGKMKKIRLKRNLSAMTGKAVILVHGIMRSSKSFGPLEKKLRENGYLVFGFDYPSTRIPITESAEYLRRCIESLEGISEISLIVHSMGGLVVRSMLMHNTDPRIKRMVMMGVPNKGAVPADLLKDNPLFKTFLGPAGQQLGTKDGLIPSLPVPEFEFGVLAGGKGDKKGYNPLLPGDDDGTVSVASTRLEGASDFMMEPILHSFLMFNEKCVDATMNFLEHGKFRADAPAQPIPQD